MPCFTGAVGSRAGLAGSVAAAVGTGAAGAEGGVAEVGVARTRTGALGVLTGAAVPLGPADVSEDCSFRPFGGIDFLPFVASRIVKAVEITGIYAPHLKVFRQ